MCSELLNLDYITDYVESAGNTILCDVETGANCEERDLEYLEKMKKEPSNAKKQLHRLSSMEDANMSEDNRLWAFKRKRILQRLLGDKDKQEL